MMASKLIFSFSYGLNLAMDQDQFVDTPVIYFGMGFDSLRITTTSTSLTTIPTLDVCSNTNPLLQFNLDSHIHFSSLKRKPLWSSDHKHLLLLLMLDALLGCLSQLKLLQFMLLLSLLLIFRLFLLLFPLLIMHQFTWLPKGRP